MSSNNISLIINYKNYFQGTKLNNDLETHHKMAHNYLSFT
jgi:hypothetical protein